MRCANCGHENTDRAKFCAKCSTPLSSTPSVDRVQLDSLLESGRFAALIKAIPEQADSGLGELRVEAQRRFSETANQMVALSEERFGLRGWSERRTRTALQDFHEKTLAGIAVDDPGEADAYAAMFIREARSQITQGSFDRARAMLNALQVLPQQRDNHRQTIRTLLTSIPSSGDGLSSEPLSPAPDPLAFTHRLPVPPDDTSSSVSPPAPDLPTLTRRLPVSPDDFSSPVFPPAPDSPAFTLRLPITPDDSISPTLSNPPTEGEIDFALAALDALEVQIERQANLSREELARPATDRPGWSELVSAMSHARSSVPANSPLLPRLSSASTRIDLLRDSTQALLSALDRPLVDWLMPGSTLEKTSADVFIKIEQGFGPDIAPVPGLRRDRDRRLDEIRVVKALLDSLEKLDGEALEIQLKELEQRQIPGTLPQMLTASRRLGEYQAKLTASRDEEAKRKDRENRVRSSYEKRRELDNLYEVIGQGVRSARFPARESAP
ncbi:MAG: zinc-ribbon domain-containing protein, partial [Chloroflexales bacterium]